MTGLLAIAVWALPLIVMVGNDAGLPLGPVFLVLMLIATTIPVIFHGTSRI